MSKNIVTRVDRNLARRLREARREVGMSTRAVAKRLPKRLTVSHATIAHYENGESVPPIDVLAALADIYKRTINWFIESRECLTELRYHNLPSRVPLGEQRQFEALASKWTDAYFNLDKHLGHVRDTKEICVDGLRPAQLADKVRKCHLNLEDHQPVQDIVSVLESFSAWAIELRATFGVDGVAGRHGDNFVVVLNPDIANERLRMTAAVELGYLLYGNRKNAERISYEFAMSLMFPPSQLLAAFKGKSFIKLIQYKERFGVSLVAMIYIAEKTEIINTTTSRWLWSEIAKRGWRRKEPGSVWRDRAIQFEIMLESAIQSKKLSWIDAERITGIREDQLKKRIDEAVEPDTKGMDSKPGTLRLAAYRVAD